MQGITHYQGGPRKLYVEHLNQYVTALANSCHSPAGSPSGGRFCSSGVDFSDMEEHHSERIPGLKRVLEVIDSVHGLPEGLQSARVEVFSDLQGAHGAYEAGERLIKLGEDSPYNVSTFVHEFGHHLTLGRYGESKMSFLNKVYNDPELKEWHLAIRETPQWAKMVEGESGGSGHASYLKDPRELFARSYAQFITTKATAGGSTILKYQHDKIREATDGLYQWSDEEFAPIGAALEKWMAKKGLLR